MLMLSNVVVFVELYVGYWPDLDQRFVTFLLIVVEVYLDEWHAKKFDFSC